MFQYIELTISPKSQRIQIKKVSEIYAKRKANDYVVFVEQICNFVRVGKLYTIGANYYGTYKFTAYNPVEGHFEVSFDWLKYEKKRKNISFRGIKKFQNMELFLL